MEVKAFLDSSIISNAYQNFSYEAAPIHWKVFFATAKFQLIDLFIFLTYIMQKVLKKRKV